MSVQLTKTQILLSIKDFGKIIFYLGTLLWNHLGHKNNDIDRQLYFQAYTVNTKMSVSYKNAISGQIFLSM